MYVLILTRYYLTNAEIEILEKYADQMAQRIPSGSVLIELGSGYEHYHRLSELRTSYKLRGY